MLKQRINGKTVATLYVEGSADDVNALKSIMEGQVDEYELKLSGGSAAALPAQIETKRIAVGADTGSHSRISCVFRIPHLPQQKNEDDVRAACLGKFDAHWEVNTSCDYVRYLKGGNR